MESITLRKFQEADTNAVINIIREAWHYDEFSSPKTAHKLAKVFLYSCLTNQTYTQVALQNELPVGIIMGKDILNHKCPFKYRIKQAQAILSLFLSAEGRKVTKIFKNVHDLDTQLLKESRVSEHGELAFFAVSASTRGKGVGKELFQNLLSYMKSQDIGQFYLFTDTSCNYGFYEHQGMVRRGKKEWTFHINEKIEKMEFYIYDYQVKK